jgi:hypothetical protein
VWNEEQVAGRPPYRLMERAASHKNLLFQSGTHLGVYFDRRQLAACREEARDPHRTVAAWKVQVEHQ